MNRLIEWLRGWAATLDMMIFDRETYRMLRDWSDDDNADDHPRCPEWRLCDRCGTG